ncbi:MAG: 6-pyruvoyltetrahydropterin/6-carboxytetrahydropterin synthase [Alphaproteobacteria bacterium]|jgi:6-pyruvoyltetrahydropterin/6-carboxytetrahydropterin synthase
MTTPLFEISQTFTFDAAHTLALEGNRPEYFRTHGHSFTAEVTLQGTRVAEKGWVIDFGLLKSVLNEVRDGLDHRMLNEVEGLTTPTLENIAEWIATNTHRLLAAHEFANETLKIHRVTVMRTTIGETCVYAPTELPDLAHAAPGVNR